MLVLVLDNRNSEPNGVYYELSDDNGAAQNLLVWRNAMEHMVNHCHTNEVGAELVANEHRILATQ